jgi:molybdenum cofactor biosynthesis enzyme MoaA
VKSRRRMQIHLEITDKCNHFCEYCYRLDKNDERESHDTSDETILEIAKKIVSSNITSVVITGGEPFVKKELALKVIEYFNSNIHKNDYICR